MAGGMNRRGASGPTLAERSANVGAGAWARGAEAGVPAGKHCWIATTGALSLPGLLIDWRRVGEQWEGRVVFVDLHLGRVSVVDTWLPGSELSPAS